MPGSELAAMVTALLCLLVGFVVLVRFFRAWLLHSTLRKAIERDSSAAPALIDRIGAMDSGRNPLGNDDRNGLVLIALALAMSGFSIIAIDDWGMIRFVLGGALFPLLVGAVLLWRRKLLKRELAEEAGLAGDHAG
jgi:hypothetical protein